MAIMIPETCPSELTAGEKRVYRFLQRALPDDFYVWYEPVIKGRYPDFVVLNDSFGILLLEVKSWSTKDLRKVSDKSIDVVRSQSDQTQSEKNPILQVRDYTFRLMDELKRNPLLRHTDGPRKGHLLFPVGYAVILTNITRKESTADLASVFSPANSICKDEMELLIESASDRAVIQKLTSLFPAYFDFDALSKEQVSTIRGTLHKETVVRVAEPSGHITKNGAKIRTNATSLVVLDTEQEKAAKALGDGHRVLFGVAGSGKTVILLARAKILAEESFQKRILVLCYNKALAARLKQIIKTTTHFTNVDVASFYSWGSRRSGLKKSEDESWDAFEKRLIEALTNPASVNKGSRYDAVLIDEGQDFRPGWFAACKAAMKDPDGGDLIIAVDGAQSLYRRSRKQTWKSMGIMASGRSRRLSHNYRNTKQILDLAWGVAHVSSEIDAPDEENALALVRPSEIERGGRIPAYSACMRHGEEVEKIITLIDDLVGKGYRPEDIGVLYPKNNSRIEAVAEQLKKTHDVLWVTKAKNKGKLNWEAPGVRVSTIHSSKGLEFKAVIFSCLDNMPGHNSNDDLSLLYVGFTRAMEELYITWTGGSQFTRAVVESRFAVPLILDSIRKAI